MFHSIITILTTAAVALHAVLGCCAHHDHSCCESHVLTAVVQHADDHCAHDHGHHHRDDADSSSEDVENERGHQHDGGQSHSCGDGECSFTSVTRSSDPELMLTFSVWCQTLFDTAHANASGRLLSLHLAAETPPDPLALSGSARAKTQVWRL